MTYLCADQTLMRYWNPLWSISLFTTRPHKWHLQGFQGRIPYITVNNATIAVASLPVRELNLLYRWRLLLKQGHYHYPNGNGIFCLLCTLFKWDPWKLNWASEKRLSFSEWNCLWAALRDAAAIQPQQQSSARRKQASEGEWDWAVRQSMCRAASAGWMQTS